MYYPHDNTGGPPDDHTEEDDPKNCRQKHRKQGLRARTSIDANDTVEEHRNGQRDGRVEVRNEEDEVQTSRYHYDCRAWRDDVVQEHIHHVRYVGEGEAVVIAHELE